MRVSHQLADVTVPCDGHLVDTRIRRTVAENPRGGETRNTQPICGGNHYHCHEWRTSDGRTFPSRPSIVVYVCDPGHPKLTHSTTFYKKKPTDTQEHPREPPKISKTLGILPWAGRGKTPPSPQGGECRTCLKIQIGSDGMTGTQLYIHRSGGVRQGV